MGFNEEELIRIRDATSGFFKRKARKQIALDLLIVDSKVSLAATGNEDSFRGDIINLLNEYTARRKYFFSIGARSYGHPEWAAAAACETYLQSIIEGNQDNLSRVYALVQQLINRA